MKLIINGNWKRFRSESYNYDFEMTTGYFERWGKTYDDDPAYAPFPEILDLECGEICNLNCNFCYKGNSPTSGSNMSFETFKSIIDKFPKYDGVHALTQIAFGIAAIDTCPDLWKMMEYCRENYIIPNITINGYGLTTDIVEKLTKLCGGISVSCYDDKNACYDAIDRLTKSGCKVINIHKMISEETYEESLNIVDDVKHDIRLKDLNAIVFLSLKKKGRGVTYNCLEYGKFKTLVEKCINNSIRYGFDSCGSSKAIQVFKELNMLSDVEQYIEPCESGVFSSYINVEGKYFPCSFLEESFDGMDMANYDSFLDIWDSNEVKEWRTKLLCNGRNCPIFEV